MRAVRAKKGVLFQNHRIMFFPDLSAELNKQRRQFDEVKKKLRAKGLVYGFIFPARLRVTVNGQAHVFQSPSEVDDFLMNMLSVSDAEKLVHAFMTSRLEYCNALLGGCPASSINKLQIVQNAAARVLTRSRKYDHITPILQSLHWLPIKFRISYKILLLAYKALNDLAPAYLTNLLSRYNPTRSLRSQNSGLLVVPRIAKSTKGGRTFSYLAPKLWNSLPDNVRGSDTLSLFKSRLKTHLFSQAFI